MKRRVILTGVDARNELAKGAAYLANAVKATLGPWGANFALDGSGAVTNDGVTIAREVQLPDEVQNRGASLLREAAVKTVEEVGDGTTTAITLAYAIYEMASRLLSKDGVAGKKTPAEVVKQIETERVEITKKLEGMATPITTEEQLINSAIVSTEDKELGTLIGSSQWKLGKDGYLLAEETAERTSSLELVEGIRIDNGVGSSFVMNNVKKQRLELKEVKVIQTSHTMKNLAQIQKILERVQQSGTHSIVVIARAWTDEAIQLCKANFDRGFLIYPISAPYVDMTERFKDLNAVLGGTFYDSDGFYLEDMQLTDLGFATRIVADRWSASFAGLKDENSQTRIDKRVEELTQKLEGSKSDFEKRLLNERIAQLKNGFGIIKVGSPSDTERKRLFDKAEDAVHAVRAAFQEGTVKGAGLAFKEISESLPDTYILKLPLLSVYEQIMSSAPKGFVIEDWVRDPVKVLRVALEKACIAAASFATVHGVVTEEFPQRLDEALGRKPE